MSDAAVKVSKNLREIARKLHGRLNAVAGERINFALFVWTGDSVANYISSAERESIIPALEQMIARWKAGMPDVPWHEKQ